MSDFEQSQPKIHFAIPDKEVLEAIGELTIVHSHLDYMLKMVIKRLTETTVSEALLATKRDSSKMLRDRIKIIAKKKFGDGQTLVKLQSLLERAQYSTDKRNNYIHSVIGREWWDGDVLHQNENNEWKKLSVEDIKVLVGDIVELRDEIITAISTFDGFLFKALSNCE